LDAGQIAGKICKVLVYPGFVLFILFLVICKKEKKR